jgi:hypothetical protein
MMKMTMERGYRVPRRAPAAAPMPAASQPAAKPPGRPMPRAWMADGGYVGDAVGCTGMSGGSGGTRSNQDYRK